jgi:hypothetical protein
MVEEHCFFISIFAGLSGLDSWGVHLCKEQYQIVQYAPSIFYDWRKYQLVKMAKRFKDMERTDYSIGLGNKPLC